MRLVFWAAVGAVDVVVLVGGHEDDVLSIVLVVVEGRSDACGLGVAMWVRRDED